MPRRRECTGTEAGRLRRQRDALAEFAAVALSAADPDRVLAEAARLCAAGLSVPLCPLLEHRAAEARAESEAKSALLREQQHRVRNNLMAVAAMLQGGERAAAEEGSRARFDAVRRR